MSSKGQYVSNPVKYLGKLYVDRTHGDRPNQVSSPAGGHPPRRLARSGCCRSRGIFIFFLLTLLWLSGCLCAAGAASEPRVLARRQPLMLSVLSAPACSPPPPCRTRAVWCLSLPGNSLSHLTLLSHLRTGCRGEEACLPYEGTSTTHAHINREGSRAGTGPPPLPAPTGE